MSCLLDIFKSLFSSKIDHLHQHNQDSEKQVTQFKSNQDDIITKICAIDINTFITGNIDGEIYHYNWIEDEHRKLKYHQASITSLIYNAEQEYFISASRDKSIQLCNMHQLETNSDPEIAMISKNAHDLSVIAIDQNRNNYKLWSGGRDTFIKLWDVNKQCLIFQNDIHRNIPQHICVDNNSHTMIECCEDLKLRIWDDRENKVIRSIETGPNIPLSCDISSDGMQVIVSFNGFQGNGCELKMYDIRRDYKEIWSQPQAHNEAVTICKFIDCISSTDINILSGSKDQSLKIWDIDAQFAKTASSTSELSQAVNDISIVDNVAYIASNNGSIHVLQLSTNFEKKSEIVAVGK